MKSDIIIVSLWTRVKAILIDALLLGLIGMALGFFFSESFIQMGDYARLVGWVISTIYFSIFNSGLTDGQTLGKRMLSIQVTDIDGKTLPWQRTIWRALLVTTPTLMNGFEIPGRTFDPVSGALQTLVIAVFILGGFLFFVLNKNTRQGIHDVAVKS